MGTGGDRTPRLRGAAQALPCPGVRFGDDFLRRLERLSVRLSAARERHEGAGSAGLAGGGEEFVGYRPYRPGEDLTQLDWSLFARLDRPYVRVTRREAAERWAILVDASASMGVGPPGKLQVAAEAACAIACVGLRMGAATHVALSTSRTPAIVRKKEDLPALLRFLERARAHGDEGLGRHLETRSLPKEAGRCFLIGDLLDMEPGETLAIRRRGRELFLLQLLAPCELAPAPGGAVEWQDPEGPGRLSRALDPATLGAYRRELERRLQDWDRFAARHGFHHGTFSTELAFESIVTQLLERD